MVALACVSIAGAVAHAAAPPEEHPLRLLLSGSLTRDANVFRLPGFVDPQFVLGKSSKSDQIKATAVGLRVDQPYAQQRFQFELTDTAYRYSNFSFLNFDAFDYRGAWLWHLTPRLSGNLSVQRNQVLNSFADFRSFERNVRTIESRRFDLDGWISGGWHVFAAASQYELKNSVAFLEEQDYRTTAGEAGLKYLAQSGSSIALVRRSTDGDYVNRVIDVVNLFDSRFRQTDTELRAKWIASGRSTLYGTLTWLDRRHEHFAQRDFSGAAGRLEYVWTPAGRLQMKLSASRDIASWWDLVSSYYVNNTVAVVPTWRVSARTAVNLRLSRSVRDFRGPVIPVAGPLRSYAVSSAQVGAEWLLRRSVTLSASVQRDRRSSTEAALEFDDTIANLSLLVTFF